MMEFVETQDYTLFCPANMADTTIYLRCFVSKDLTGAKPTYNVESARCSYAQSHDCTFSPDNCPLISAFKEEVCQ